MSILFGGLKAGGKSNKGGGGGGGSNPPKVKKLSRIDGAWSWFTDPRAVYYNGNVYAGAVSQNGSIIVLSWPDGGGVDGSFVLNEKLEQDDHANPAFLVRDSDKKIITWYSEHAATTIYQRISTNAEDITAWGGEGSLDAELGGTEYTYPNAVQLLDETDDPIYLFYRDITGPAATDHRIAFSTSDDGGASWAAQTQLIIATYAKIAKNGEDRIDIAVANNPVNVGVAHGIFHCYYEGGSYYESDGTEIVAALPFATGDMTEVYDGSVTKGWLWDVAVDGSGYPVIVYATFADIDDHVYRYARWDGDSWEDNSIVAAGGTVYEAGGAQDYYSGGIVLDHDDVDTVYLSREINGVHEVWKYTTGDGGSSWSSEALTSGNNINKKQFRPFVIRDHVSDIVLWLSGKYTTYTNYKTDVVRG